MREEKKMKQKEKEKNKEKCVERLRELLEGVDRVYWILRHVSRSGMYRVISLCIVKNNEILLIDHLAAPLLEGYDEKHGGLKAHGCGMNMGFHLIYNLSQRVFGNGYALKDEWL